MAPARPGQALPLGQHWRGVPLEPLRLSRSKGEGHEEGPCLIFQVSFPTCALPLERWPNTQWQPQLRSL